MEFKKREAQYLVKLLKAALTDSIPLLPEGDFDWESLYDLSVLQKVEAMAYIGLSKVSGVPDGVIDRFENEYKREIAFEMIRHSEGRKILSSFESAGIDCMPLKGWIIKDMYPMPAMRYMCDIDILFKKEYADEVKSVLENLGYDAVEFGGNPDVYMKKPILNIEMHKALIQDKTDHFEKTWDRAVLKENKKHTFSMSLEDYYIYMAAHLRKHFFGSGTGVRSVCDIYVFLRENKGELDDGYIFEKLRESGIYEFDCKVRKLCAMWFENGEVTEEIKKLGDKFLYCGAFGTEESNSLNTAAAELDSMKGKSFRQKKIRYIIQLMFPPISVMKEEYGFLRRFPLLLPFSWVMRGFRSVFIRKNAVKKVLGNAVNVTEETTEKRS